MSRASKMAAQMDPSKVLLLSTGSQGEQFAALTRMAAKTHRDIKLTPEDTVVFSSSQIPGNELAIVSVLNNLADIGVTMIDSKKYDTHVSGHGYAEEIKLMTSLLNPKYFAPIHGELYMRYQNRDLIVDALRFKKENTFIMKNGQGIILGPKGIRLMTDKEAIPCPPIMIELGEKVHEHVLVDRRLMADGGTIFVAIQTHDGKIKNLQIRSRGFRYMHMKHEIFKLLEKEIRDVFVRTYDPSRPERSLEETIGKSAQKFFWQKFKKEPLVEAVIQ